MVGIETIVWDNRPRMCYHIESRYPSSTAGTWVRTADNRVLRHEQTVLGGLKVVMELEQSNE